MLLHDYGVDGLRFDDTIDIRTFGPGRTANNEGGQLLREINSSYRNTDPKQPSKITIAEGFAKLWRCHTANGPGWPRIQQPMGRHDGQHAARRGDEDQRFGSRPGCR